jgi:16S rRNA U516 pseudouridylate synthase RsuA-like enzyme
VQNKLQPGTPKPRLFTVGRLDVATTGLIVVTNDGNFIILGRNYLGMNTLIIQDLKLAALLSGEFAQKVAHPSSNITKE